MKTYIILCMDISSLLPFLLTQNSGTDKNALTSLLPALMAGQKGGGGNDMSALMGMLANKSGGGNDMSALMGMLANKSGGTDGNSKLAPELENLTQNQAPSFDTNPQYLARYYSDKDSFANTQSAPKAQESIPNPSLSSQAQNNNQAQNPLFSLLGAMNGANSGGLNPMQLLPLLSNMNSNNSSSRQASTQSIKTNAPLTAPIEDFAPSNIILNIRKLLKS